VVPVRLQRQPAMRADDQTAQERWAFVVAGPVGAAAARQGRLCRQRQRERAARRVLPLPCVLAVNGRPVMEIVVDPAGGFRLNLYDRAGRLERSLPLEL
jgi:hypothetical protein